jgi:hypothetical protein
MTLLADRLLAIDAQSPGLQNAMIAQAQGLLRTPAPGEHTRVDQIGKADRFVIADDFFDYIGKSGSVLDSASITALMQSARPLLPQFWMESRTAQAGWLIQRDECARRIGERFSRNVAA